MKQGLLHRQTLEYLSFLWAVYDFALVAKKEKSYQTANALDTRTNVDQFIKLHLKENFKNCEGESI